MHRCFFCHDVVEAASATSAASGENTHVAHTSCVAAAQALLAAAGSAPLGRDEELHPLLERVGPDLLLVGRNYGSAVDPVLAYLSAQSDPINAEVIYDWLRRNEVAVSNAPDLIYKLKQRGLIAVMNRGKERLIRITDTGRAASRSVP